MKCSKCGKEAPLKRGLCSDCYKEVLQNKYRKRKKNFPKINYILKNLEKNEKILNKIDTSTIIYLYIVSLLAVSVILFPKTILEFFVNQQKIYFLVLMFNILLFFFAIYLSLYFMSRDIYLTDKRIIGKWGLFKIKKINIPLSSLTSIDSNPYSGLEIETRDKNYFFDFVGNDENFKITTIMQIKNLINSTDNEAELMSFSHSIQDDEFDNLSSNMITCKCCKKQISKDSITCVYCGQPIPENERTADIFIKILCLLLPPIGIILFLLNIGPFPKFAKQCLGFSLILPFILIIVYLSLLSII